MRARVTPELACGAAAAGDAAAGGTVGTRERGGGSGGAKPVCACPSGGEG
jgi:hypothetical protein